MYITLDDMVIRKANVEDAKTLCDWWNNGELMKDVGFPNGLGKRVEEVEKQIVEGKKVLLMLLLGNKPIGEAVYGDLNNGICEIGIKICEINLQGRGYGKRFLSLFINELFDTGYEKIVLDTDLENIRAQKLYEKVGFKRLRVHKNSWRNQVGEVRSSVDFELVKKDFINRIEK